MPEIYFTGEKRCDTCEALMLPDEPAHTLERCVKHLRYNITVGASYIKDLTKRVEALETRTNRRWGVFG